MIIKMNVIVILQVLVDLLLILLVRLFLIHSSLLRTDDIVLVLISTVCSRGGGE